MDNTFFSDMVRQDLNPTILYCSRVKDAHITASHSHPNIEIAYILSGTGCYQVEERVYEVKQGDLLICNPGIVHRSIVTDPADCTLEFVAGFTDVFFQGMPDNQVVLPDGGHLLTLSNEAKREFSRCCYEILEENASTEPGRYYMIQAQMIRMLVLIYRAISEKSEPEMVGLTFESYSRSYVVKKILHYLNDNYAQKISLDQIAHNMYLSPVYISKIFKEKTGDSPINYLIRIRLARAKELLDKDAGNIKAIAAQVGYDDVYHFSKLFKKYYGVSPMNYRKSVR